MGWTRTFRQMAIVSTSCPMSLEYPSRQFSIDGRPHPVSHMSVVPPVFSSYLPRHRTTYRQKANQGSCAFSLPPKKRPWQSYLVPYHTLHIPSSQPLSVASLKALVLAKSLPCHRLLLPHPISGAQTTQISIQRLRKSPRTPTQLRHVCRTRRTRNQ